MYLFYLDESGEREYESDSQYFVLCALGVPENTWQELDARINALKQECFGRSEVEIKSSWLRRKREQQKHYIEPYGICEDSLRKFTAQLYQTLLEADIVLIACVVDKFALRQASTVPESPLLQAYLTLLEQIQSFLRTRQDFGIVVFDKINESQFKKYGYEQELAQQHLLWRQQVAQRGETARVIEGLLFLPSHENNFIQLADLCAYNIYRQFVNHGDEWDTGFANKYDYFARIEGKLCCDADGNYRGYGLRRCP